MERLRYLRKFIMLAVLLVPLYGCGGDDSKETSKAVAPPGPAEETNSKEVNP